MIDQDDEDVDIAVQKESIENCIRSTLKENLHSVELSVFLDYGDQSLGVLVDTVSVRGKMSDVWGTEHWISHYFFYQHYIKC